MTSKDLQELLVRVWIVSEARFDSLDVIHCGAQTLAFVVIERRDVNGASG
jgi:hypothetical protein